MLALGAHTSGCGLSSGADLDTFQFACDSGARVRVNLQGQTNDLDPRVEIRRPDFQLAEDRSCAAAQFSLCSVGFDMVCEQTGIHNVAVSDLGTNNSGAYTLQIEAIDPPTDAIPTAYDETVPDTISPATDVDRYTFNADAGTRLRLTMHGASNNFDPRAQLRGPGTGTLADPAVDELCNAAQFDICSFDFDYIPAVSGVHTLFFFDNGLNNTGNYDFTVTCLEGECDSDGVPPVDPLPPLLGYDETASAQIGPASDVDPYRFNADPGTRVRIVVHGATNDFDARAEVRDASGDPLAISIEDHFCSAAQFGLCSVAFEFVPLTAGEHTLLISDAGLNNGGNYDISLTCLEGPCDSDGEEPFDELAQAIKYDESIAADIDPPSDVDPYRFNADPGTLVRVTLRGASNALDVRAEVRDASGDVDALPIVDEFCDAGRFDSCSLSLDFVPETSGEHTVFISDSGSNNGGSYDLMISCIDGLCDSDGAEPFELAPSISSLGFPIQGQITPPSDVDIYAIQAEAGSLMRVHVTGTSNDFDPRIELRDPQGDPLADPVIDEFCGAAQFAVCSFAVELKPTASGPYRLIVSEAGVNNAGNYSVTVACVLGPCDSDGDGLRDVGHRVIDYNEPLVANPGQGEDGGQDVVISPASDIDCYRFQGCLGSVARIQVQGESNAFDSRILVYDASGDVDQVPMTTFCDAGQFNPCSIQLDYIPGATGTHTLCVLDSGNDNTGNYNVSINIVAGACIGQPFEAATCIGGATEGCADNCQLLADPTQADADGDGRGDACDCGDFTGDGFTNTLDARLAQRCVVGEVPCSELCDVTNDGVCNTIDARIIQRHAVRSIDTDGLICRELFGF